jgi:hypothetical protein
MWKQGIFCSCFNKLMVSCFDMPWSALGRRHTDINTVSYRLNSLTLIKSHKRNSNKTKPLLSTES